MFWAECTWMYSLWKPPWGEAFKADHKVSGLLLWKAHLETSEGCLALLEAQPLENISYLLSNKLYKNKASLPGDLVPVFIHRPSHFVGVTGLPNKHTSHHDREESVCGLKVNSCIFFFPLNFLNLSAVWQHGNGARRRKEVMRCELLLFRS